MQPSLLAQTLYNSSTSTATRLKVHWTHLLHGHATPEDGSHGEVASVPGVTGRHHVLGVEHLLGELWHGERAVRLRVA